MKKFSKILAVALCAATVFGLAVYLNSSDRETSFLTAPSELQTAQFFFGRRAQPVAPANTVVKEVVEEEDLGFTEVEIFSGVEREFLNLNAVYFQPVDMTGGYKAEDYDCHLELDVSALQNGLGYGTGDWVPYLTVEYAVKKNDSDYTVSGTFMPMAASDGPHYGANIKMDGDGLYTVTFTVKFPDSSTYLIHTDETGPDEHSFPDAIVYTYDEWQFTDGAWAE